MSKSIARAFARESPSREKVIELLTFLSLLEWRYPHEFFIRGHCHDLALALNSVRTGHLLMCEFNGRYDHLVFVEDGESFDIGGRAAQDRWTALCFSYSSSAKVEWKLVESREVYLKTLVSESIIAEVLKFYRERFHEKP